MGVLRSERESMKSVKVIEEPKEDLNEEAKKMMQKAGTIKRMAEVAKRQYETLLETVRQERHELSEEQSKFALDAKNLEKMRAKVRKERKLNQKEKEENLQLEAELKQRKEEILSDKFPEIIERETC